MREGWIETTVEKLVNQKIIEKPLDGNHGEIHPKKSDFTKSGIPFVMASDLVKGAVNQKTCNFISREQADSLRKGFAKNGDVLLSHKGTIGRSAILQTSLDYVVLTPQVTYYRILDNSLLNNRFLYYSFHRPKFQLEIKKIAGTGSTRAYIGITQQLQLHIPIAPLYEQKRIVAILDEAFEGIDRAIANAEKNLANSRELFESYLNNIFSQKSDKWKWVTLSELTTDITDGDHQAPPKSQSGIPFITISNIDKQNRTIDFSNTFKVPEEYFKKIKNNRKPRQGDLLYTVTGSYGIPVIIDYDKDFCFQRHIGLIRPNNETNSRCLYYILLSRYLLNQADECATGTAQKTVSLSQLRRFFVPKISRQEQEIIVGELDFLYEKICRLETIYSQKLTALNELKQSILQKAFTGELTADTLKTVKEEIAA